MPERGARHPSNNNSIARYERGAKAGHRHQRQDGRQWRKRETVEDRKTSPTEPSSTVLSTDEEAMIVAFRRHTPLPLDDCLYTLQPTIPHPLPSSLHRCLQRHGMSRLPDMEGDKPNRQKFKRYPIGYFHIRIVELRTNEGKLYLFVAIDRTSKFAVARHVSKANRMIKDATVKRYHYESHGQLRSHLSDFLDAYNCARHVKTFSVLTP